MALGQGSRCHDLEDDHEIADSANDSEDDTLGGTAHEEAHGQHDLETNIEALDDETLFGIVKKVVCVSIRNIISSANAPTAGISTASYGAGGRGISSRGSGRVAPTKAITKLNVSYFSEVLESLNPDKQKIIESYGFGSLLLFEKCSIPIPFAHWVADHVQFNSSNIIVKSISIPFSPQSVHYVLGTPIGGHIIRKVDSKSGKGGFLKAMGLTTLPSAKAFGDNLLKENISDDDLVRSFLIVALVTFLCPNSSIQPSTEYLEPLVDVQKANEWDWSEFVHYWLLQQIKKYNKPMKKADHASIPIGGCLYVLCVVYLDFLNFGRQQLPCTLPRLVVWKGDMINEKAKLDCVQGDIYGKLPILPLKLTCYHKRAGAQTPTPTCVIDGSMFKKSLVECVQGDMSPAILDDLTALYTKHATKPADSAAENAQNIILDVIGYFYQQHQVKTMPNCNNEYSTRGVSGNKSAHAADSNGDQAKSTLHENNDIVDHETHTSISQRAGAPVHVDAPSDCGDASASMEAIVNAETNVAAAYGSHQVDTRLQDIREQDDLGSGNTVIIPSVGGDCSSSHDSVAETERVSPSLNGVSDEFYLSQGCCLAKKRRLSTSGSANNENAGSTIATRTRSRQSSLSPDILATVTNQVAFVDNPEALFRKKNVKILATRLQGTRDAANIDVPSTVGNDPITNGDLCNDSGPHAAAPNVTVKDTTKTALQRIANKILNDPLAKRHKSSQNNGGPEAHGSCFASSTEEVSSHGPSTHRDLQASQQVPAVAIQNVEHTQLKSASFDHMLGSGIPSPKTRPPDPPSVEHTQLKSASFDHMLGPGIPSPKTRPPDPPSVNTDGTGPTFPMHSLDVSQRCSPRIDPILNDAPVVGSFLYPGLSTPVKYTVWDDFSPSFRLLEELDDYGNFIEDPRKRRPVGLPCDGKTFYNDPNCVQSNSADAVMQQPKCTQAVKFNSSQIFLEPSNTHGTGNLSADVSKQDNAPIYDKTPELSRRRSYDNTVAPIPIAAVNSQGRLIVLSSQESPEAVNTRQTHFHDSPEVQVTGERIFHATCNTMAQECDDLYNESEMSCFKKCERIGFNLGTSSAGKRSRRPRRIVQPNSYYRNFQVNVCNARFSASVEARLAYDCLMFFSCQPDYASKEVINYDNVRVTFEELGKSMSRINKKSVHIHVINALCRKLFRDRHPKDSRKHYFFSPVGDYLMSHEGNQSYMFEKCGKCFRLANGSFKFVLSDYLFFPILHEDHWFVFLVALQDGYFVFLDSFFDEDDLYQKEVRILVIPNFLRAWDHFIGIDWNFDEFVIHHAPVPKQDKKYFAKYDDGIFVMKFLELWDPCVNMMLQFSSSNINDIRIQYISTMVFSQHNSSHHAKATLSNHKAMLELKRSTGFQASSSTLF